MFKKKRRSFFSKNYTSPSPLTRKRQQRHIGKRTKYLIGMISIIAITFLLYWVYFSSYFNVREIKMAERDIAQEGIANQIEAKLQNQLGENLVSINTNELATATKKLFPELETLKISKNYPSTLEIQFNQFPLVANVIHESSALKKNYIINSVGYIMKEDFENPSLPYIYMKEDEPANPKLALIDAKKILYILESISYFEDKFGMGIKSVTYKKTAREIHLLTERDFEIWLDIQIPAEDQFKKLKKALVKLDIYKENLLYIDLRIAGANGDKIVYKRQ